MIASRETFDGLWQRAGGSNGSYIFEDLSARYNEPHRHYHNLRHIEECLAELETIHLNDEDRLVVELAIWFHDAIYETLRQDNEEKSAELFRSKSVGIPDSVVEHVAALILNTRFHDSSPNDPVAAVFIDIDLAILGASTERFREYDDAIRSEYSWVPELLYNMKRRKALRRFLDRDRIYTTPTFFERLELNARENLRRAIGGGADFEQ